VHALGSIVDLDVSAYDWNTEYLCRHAGHRVQSKVGELIEPRSRFAVVHDEHQDGSGRTRSDDPGGVGGDEKTHDAIIVVIDDDVPPCVSTPGTAARGEPEGYAVECCACACPDSACRGVCS
jgi:hypothetical protein